MVQSQKFKIKVLYITNSPWLRLLFQHSLNNVSLSESSVAIPELHGSPPLCSQTRGSPSPSWPFVAIPGPLGSPLLCDVLPVSDDAFWSPKQINIYIL